MDKLSLLKSLFITGVDVEKYLPFVDEAIATLDEREQCVLQKRFSGMSLAAIGRELRNMRGETPPHKGVHRGRVYLIAEKAIRKLRHPSRMKVLRGEITAAVCMKELAEYSFEATLRKR